MVALDHGLQRETVVDVGGRDADDQRPSVRVRQETGPRVAHGTRGHRRYAVRGAHTDRMAARSQVPAGLLQSPVPLSSEHRGKYGVEGS
ncbi:hypothetical protein GCM10009646_40430 [Streptomyces aureus]